jgi:serine/threonine protein kinase
MQLERHMIGLPEQKKHELRRVLEHEENSIQKETRKKISVSDFESLAVIGRGAFGEVRLARRTGKKDDPQTGQIFALKSMKKEMMVVKNQVHHVKAERDALSAADDANRWLTLLSYSFFDESHIYMAMEFMPGGDLMSLLIKEDTFSEDVTRFFMAEAAQAISSVHALGYIHRDIKPDNMLLSSTGHLKLTDLGLCKKVGDVSPTDEPEVVLEMLKRQGQAGMGNDWNATQVGDVRSSSPGAPGLSKHRSADDAMAMSIDDGNGFGNGGPVNPRDAKTRREVSCRGGINTIALVLDRNQNGSSSLTESEPVYSRHRWPTRLSVLPITLHPRYWPRRMVRRATRTPVPLTGGRWV